MKFHSATKKTSKKDNLGFVIKREIHVTIFITTLYLLYNIYHWENYVWMRGKSIRFFQKIHNNEDMRDLHLFLKNKWLKMASHFCLQTKYCFLGYRYSPGIQQY